MRFSGHMVRGKPLDNPHPGVDVLHPQTARSVRCLQKGGESADSIIVP